MKNPNFISFLNDENPVHGSDGIPNAGKQATEAINAFDDASDLGVTSDFKDFDCLLDGNRAYTAKPDSLKSRFYSDELEYKQDMIDQYESIKAEYDQDPNDLWEFRRLEAFPVHDWTDQSPVARNP
jgi:hypothetical protein